MNYALFPGKGANGFDHTLEPGVTVIVGTNGIGKTTMLNLIYRLLVGPYDPFKDEGGIQLTQTRLTELKQFDYFSKRDRGTSVTSIVTGEFDFGDKHLAVSRRLSDLAITEFLIDGVSIGASHNESLEPRIRQLCGCGSQYDFHLLVRSLLFFLEEKAAVVWEPKAQMEIFRILFLEGPQATDLSRLASEVQREDSRRRNMLAELNRYRKRHIKAIATASDAGVVAARANEVNERAEVVGENLSKLTEAADNFEKSRDANRQKLDSFKLDLEEANRRLEYLHHQYFASLFPRLPEVAKNVFQNLVGDAGCLVCGTRIPGLGKQFQEMAAEGSCPVCRSPKELHETLQTSAEFGSERIAEESKNIGILKGNVAELQRAVDEESENYLKVLRELRDLQNEREQLSVEAHTLNRMIPRDSGEIARGENYIKVTEEEISALGREIAAKNNDYKLRLEGLRAEIDELATNLTTFFAEYAGSFLAERCNLVFRPQKLMLGQSTEPIEFPTFAVQMTSAVSPSSGTTRTDETDVSESQKEFIDLAFRMAVLRAYAVATKTAASAMVVVETPEASLDSVFVGNAGRMLRSWCTPTDLGRNSVIASSNLNRENMISSLLGLRLEDAPHPSKEEIERRVINLLEVAAENAALRENREHYEAEFRVSTTPERDSGTIN